jgi:hypothetical protein
MTSGPSNFLATIHVQVIRLVVLLGLVGLLGFNIGLLGLLGLLGVGFKTGHLFLNGRRGWIYIHST